MAVHDNEPVKSGTGNPEQMKALKSELADYLRSYFPEPSENIKCFAASAMMGAKLPKKIRQNNLFKAFDKKSAKSDFFKPGEEDDECDYLYKADEEISINTELADRLKVLDESFQNMLLRKIDESGMTDAECYKKANISKQLFSKIRSNPDYRPKKPTVIAFAVALELDMDGTEEMLRKAGFSLSDSSKFDVIIRFCLNKGIYNVSVINEFLYDYDQVLLGSD